MRKSWFYIGFKNLVSKPLTTFLSILLVVLGVCIISLLMQLNSQFDDQLKKNAKGIDMVIGAKGSPLQLILSSIYHIDAPTGNIDYETAQKIVKHPFVKSGIPLAYGDNYKGFRILGTNSLIFNQYNTVLANGENFNKPFDVVIGSAVAQKLGISVGSEFHSSHGLQEVGEKHNDHHLKVVGVLKKSGTVVDNLILTQLETVWQAHSSNTSNPKQITAMLIKYKNAMAITMLPKIVNSKKGMQAALPAVEVSRLNKLLGFSFATINWIAFAIIIVAALSIFITLFNAMDERKYEVALLRVIGFKKLHIFMMVITESLFISVIGYIIGIVISRFGMLFVKSKMQASLQYTTSFNLLTEEKQMFGMLIVICVLAAITPAIKALKIDISKTLTNA